MPNTNTNVFHGTQNPASQPAATSVDSAGTVFFNSVTIGNYANDAAAATGGVAVGGVYRNGSVLMIRVA
jgi:hypothetical protein